MGNTFHDLENKLDQYDRDMAEEESFSADFYDTDEDEAIELNFDH